MSTAQATCQVDINVVAGSYILERLGVRDMCTKYFAQKPRSLASVFLYANIIFRLICTKLSVCGGSVFENFYLFLVCSTSPGRDVCELL